MKGFLYLFYGLILQLMEEILQLVVRKCFKITGMKVDNIINYTFTSQLSSFKRKPDCLGYIRDYTTQLYGG